MKIDAELLSFPFKDARWQNKMLIGGLLALTGFVLLPLMLFLNGYGLRILRHTIREGQPTLPEWDNWGDLFLDGLRAVVVFFVYLLPVWMLLCAVFSCLFLPLLVVPTTFAFPSEAEAQGTASVLGMLFFFGGQIMAPVLFALAALPALFLGYFAMVAVTRMVALGTLNAAFDFGAVWRLGVSGFNHFFLALVVYMGLTFAVNYLTSLLIYTIVLCCVYPFVLAAWSFYAQTLFGALFGLAYRAAQPAEAVAPAV